MVAILFRPQCVNSSSMKFKLMELVLTPEWYAKWKITFPVITGKLGPVSISEKMSYRKISWSLEAARFVFGIVRSLWNLTGTSAAVLPMCLSNFKAMRQFEVPISWLRDFTRSYVKTSFRILRRGPGYRPRYFSGIYFVWLISPWTKWPPFHRWYFSDAFLWMKNFVFWFEFHWRLFPMLQLMIIQHWFG